MNSSKKKRQLLFGIASRFLAAWQMRKTWGKRHFFAGRKLTSPKSSPHQPSQIGAGDTTFPNFLTDLLPTRLGMSRIYARLFECLSVLYWGAKMD